MLLNYMFFFFFTIFSHVSYVTAPYYVTMSNVSLFQRNFKQIAQHSQIIFYRHCVYF